MGEIPDRDRSSAAEPGGRRIRGMPSTGISIKWRFAVLLWSLVATSAVALVLRWVDISNGAKWAVVLVLALFNTAIAGWFLWPLVSKLTAAAKDEALGHELEPQWVGNQLRRRRRNRPSGKRR